MHNRGIGGLQKRDHQLRGAQRERGRPHIRHTLQGAADVVHGFREGIAIRREGVHGPGGGGQRRGDPDAHAAELIALADQLGERALHPGQAGADGVLHLAEQRIHRALLRLQGLHHRFRGQLTLSTQGAQRTHRDAHAFGDGLTERGRLLHDRVQFFAAQRARGEGLAELHQRRARRRGRSPADHHRFADGLDDAGHPLTAQLERVLVLRDALIQLRGGTQRLAGFLRNAEHRVLRGGELGAVRGDQFQPVGNLRVDLGLVDQGADPGTANPQGQGAREQAPCSLRAEPHAIKRGIHLRQLPVNTSGNLRHRRVGTRQLLAHLRGSGFETDQQPLDFLT
ncbi:hypothetical protein PS723_04391 [Pseudomonas fluorescens]|uniref:Uncharacterized protein n=1 Tax=Pseudomonas fluorescens TaxID=294 RepID=A0A5E7E9H5_PSEFL|nr:hypothetical protein PS723_04391 [Pseudomonas fluorescens]